MRGNLQKRSRDIENALDEKRSETILADQSARNWENRANLEQNELNQKALQKETSSLKNQSTVGINERESEAAQGNQLQESNKQLEQTIIECREIVLNTNECDISKGKVITASSVNESHVEKLENQNGETNDLKRKSNDVSSERDLFKKKVKSTHTDHQTLDAPSLTIEKSALGKQPQTDTECDENDSVSSTDESTSADISMFDNVTEFSSLLSDPNSFGSDEDIAEPSVSSNFAVEPSQVSESSDVGSNTTMSSSNSSSCSVDHEAVQQNESAKLAEMLFSSEGSERKKIPILKRSSISREDIDKNRDANYVKDTWLESDSMEYSDAAGYSKEERETLPWARRPYLAKGMPEHIVRTVENRHLHTTQLMKECLQDEDFCDVLTFIFIETGKIPIGIFSIGESVIENASMSFLHKFLIEISEELGIEISAFNIDILQLAYGCTLGNDLRGLESHPQIQKMLKESHEFYKLCRDKLFPIVFRVMNKMVDPDAVKVLCGYYSEGTIAKFSEINKDVPSFIDSIMKECQIPEGNHCKMNHPAHFLRAQGEVATAVKQKVKNAVGIICNAKCSSHAQKSDTDAGTLSDGACSSDAQKPDYDAEAVVTRIGIYEKGEEKPSSVSSFLENTRYSIRSMDEKSPYYVASMDVEAKSMGILEIVQMARKGVTWDDLLIEDGTLTKISSCPVDVFQAKDLKIICANLQIKGFQNRSKADLIAKLTKRKLERDSFVPVNLESVTLDDLLIEDNTLKKISSRPVDAFQAKDLKIICANLQIKEGRTKGKNYLIAILTKRKLERNLESVTWEDLLIEDGTLKKISSRLVDAFKTKELISICKNLQIKIPKKNKLVLITLLTKRKLERDSFVPVNLESVTWDVLLIEDSTLKKISSRPVDAFKAKDFENYLCQSSN